MLNKNIKIVNNRYSSTTCVQPEKIDLNIKKNEEHSFFKEMNRNTKDYEKLLQDNPVLLETYYYCFSEDELSWMT